MCFIISTPFICIKMNGYLKVETSCIYIKLFSLFFFNIKILINNSKLKNIFDIYNIKTLSFYKKKYHQNTLTNRAIEPDLKTQLIKVLN
jgi:hypothetical protein